MSSPENPQELDLVKLGTPLVKLYPEVLKSLQRLEQKWEEARTIFKSFVTPVSCEVSVLEKKSSLIWCKFKGKWGFILKSLEFGEEQSLPYEEWSAKTRVEMLELLPSLFKEAEQAINKFIERIE